MDSRTYYLLIFLLILLILLLVKVLIVRLSKNKKYQKYRKYDLKQIDKLSGEEFERLLEAHFIDKGYKVSLTPKTNDYGADLLLRKGDEKIVVQAKRYKNKVGNSAIQEIVAAKAYYKANKAMVVTNSFFTQNAINLAKANNVELWDRRKMSKKFRIVQ